MIEKFRVSPNEKIKFDKIKQDIKDYDEKLEQDLLKNKIKKNIKIIDELQQRLYAESKQSLLVILQAIDTGGKDGTIRKVFGPINPQGCIVTSFKAPNKLEMAHDFLWRIHQAVPPKGMIVIFNRSHYEDVLVVKVHKLISKEECKSRYEHIKNFEKLLDENGTRIIKFFLYITKDEQKKRFEERIAEKEKNWKFSLEDLEERKLWDDYIKQYEEVLEHTSTVFAPWYVIPANDNKFRNYLVSSIVRKKLEEMNPKFPKPVEGIDKIKIV